MPQTVVGTEKWQGAITLLNVESVKLNENKLTQIKCGWLGAL